MAYFNDDNVAKTLGGPFDVTRLPRRFHFCKFFSQAPIDCRVSPIIGLRCTYCHETFTALVAGFEIFIPDRLNLTSWKEEFPRNRYFNLIVYS